MFESSVSACCVCPEITPVEILRCTDLRRVGWYVTDVSRYLIDPRAILDILILDYGTDALYRKVGDRPIYSELHS